MIQWDIKSRSIKSLRPHARRANVIECDQTGECFVHDTCRPGGMEWLESHLRERGKEGWELVQSAYHQREILCIWKKKIEI